MLREVIVSNSAKVDFETDPFLAENKDLASTAKGILEDHMCMPECQLRLTIKRSWAGAAVDEVEFNCTTSEASQGFLCPEPDYPFECAELLANLAFLTEAPERPE